MNPVDRVLSRTPASDDSWHCPWFRLIEMFSLNGVIFGGYSYVSYDAGLGLVAVFVGLIVAAFSLGSRSRRDAAC